MFDTRDRLAIFEDFITDRPEKSSTVNGIVWATGRPTQDADFEPPEHFIVVKEGRPPRWEVRGGWFKRLWRKFLRALGEVRVTLTVEEYFASMKNSVEELKLVNERARGYDAALLAARKNRQTALVEQLEGKLRVLRAETQLVAIGYTRFITEETVVAFTKKASRGLRLDWIRNFARVIPDDVLALKARADELDVFDNYVVLHYDPHGKSWAETQAQRQARRKDPILFGVLKDSRRLYFVADWIDEFCDLTLEDIADQMGSAAVEELA
jgi:hypothetical protein